MVTKIFNGNETLSSEDLMADGDQDGDGKLSVDEVVEEFENITELDDFMLEYHDEL